MSHDYLREIDLNPTIGGVAAPITSPLDPRAMHYFGFTADAQQITLVQPFPGQPRILASFHYGNQPTAAPPQPEPPIDAILDFSGGPPLVERTNHLRGHVLVWIDPANVPPMGQPAVVRVTAQARE
jgi:hypothetical protein